jgi:putative endonuclease
MSFSKKEVGRIGEKIASEFLVRKGFEIIDRNFRKPWGEIDIIALKGDIVRFVEVKAVSRDTSSGISREMPYQPEEMAHTSKLEKVARTAQSYMDGAGDKREFQIDVVTVILNTTTREARCTLYEQVL